MKVLATDQWAMRFLLYQWKQSVIVRHFILLISGFCHKPRPLLQTRSPQRTLIGRVIFWPAENSSDCKILDLKSEQSSRLARLKLVGNCIIEWVNKLRSMSNNKLWRYISTCSLCPTWLDKMDNTAKTCMIHRELQKYIQDTGSNNKLGTVEHLLEKRVYL